MATRCSAEQIDASYLDATVSSELDTSLTAHERQGSLTLQEELFGADFGSARANGGELSREQPANDRLFRLAIDETDEHLPTHVLPREFDEGLGNARFSIRFVVDAHERFIFGSRANDAPSRQTPDPSRP